VNEADWLASADPEPMLKYLRDRGSDRKLRLFACACCRRIWHLLDDEISRHAIELMERYPDPQSRSEDVQLRSAMRQVEYEAESRMATAENSAGMARSSAAFAVFNALARDSVTAADYAAADGASAVYHDAFDVQAPSAAAARSVERAAQTQLLREVFGNPFRSVVLPRDFLAWRNGTLPRLARAIYDDGAFERLPILADALEDAGCDDRAVLEHCRQPGTHVKGCWVVDLLLDRG
jgi:hypothetical protein